MILANAARLTFRSPELWVYLLGLSVLLSIALRRVRARQQPLNDELYSKTVAIEHVQSGVAWIRPDGAIRTINPAYAEMLAGPARDFLGRNWFDLFAQQEHARLQEAYSQMLLLGKANLEALCKRADGTFAALEVRLAAVHDHKMRFMGHHCLVVDHAKEHLIEAQIREQPDSNMGRPVTA
ncbi:MAG TPA: PAS domain-containing protein [Bryobacteraceae bacterium]|nr:PAS domain-containing protein [Bryobacteraceae bacterium]